MIFQNNGKDLLEQIFKQYYAEQDDNRYDSVTMLIDFYENDHIPYIRQKLNREPQSNDDFPYTFIPITRHIIKKKSLVYKKEPTRDMSESYLDWTKEKDHQMKEAERQTRLVPVVAMRPYIVAGKDYFKYEIVRHFYGICDPLDKQSFKAIMYKLSVDHHDSYDELWAYWDDERFVIVNSNGVPIKEQEAFGGVADMKNPYGEIPFAFLRFNNIIDDCWVGGAYDIVNANWNIDIAMTDLNWLHRYASFKQPIVIANASDLGKIKWGYDQAVFMTPNDNPQGQAVEFDLLDLEANFENAFYLIQKQMDMISMMSGVNLNWELKGAPSGFSLVVKNMDLLMDWEDDIGFCRQWERSLFEKEKIVLKTDAKRTFADKEISVNFADVKFPVDPKETRDQVDWEIENNYSTGLDYMATQDQDATEDELKSKRDENKKYNDEYAGTTPLTVINT